MADLTVTFQVPDAVANILIPLKADDLNPILIDSQRAEDLLASVFAMIQEQAARPGNITPLEPQ